MDQYIMAFDQGTTSSRCIIYDRNGDEVCSASRSFKLSYPESGWVEQDPEDLWRSQIDSAREALKKSGLTYKDIAGLGIANQRETTIVWDKKTGKAIYPAIVWQDRRTAGYCDILKDEGYEKTIKAKTGLIADPYFSATKIKWILDNVFGARKSAEKGDLLFGTVDTWIIWKLTAGAAHVTDYSNASRTMLFNIHELKWDEDLKNKFAIPDSLLPRPVANNTVVGESAEEFFGGPIKICGAAGDQQAALFGQCCHGASECKMTYGTGGFMLVNTGTTALLSSNGLLTTVAWQLDGKTSYALEGSVFIAGAVIQWLRDELKIIDDAAQSAELASSVDSTGDVYLVPAYTGMGAPYWDPYARGTICGITRETGRAHIVRAALEAIAYQTKDLAVAMEEDTGSPLVSFRADGGACKNDFLMQFQADMLGIDVMRPGITEATALGAAYLAGLGAGYWSDTDELKEIGETHFKVFKNSMADEEREKLLSRWHEAVKRSLRWSLK